MSKALFYLLPFAFFFLPACKRKWTEKDRSEFVSGCLKTSLKEMGQEKARAYCDCLVKKVSARYPNANDIQYIKYDTAIVSLARGCLEHP